MTKKVLLLSLGLYLLSSVVSFAVFSRVLGGSYTQVSGELVDEETALGSLLDINPSEPKDQACPLNGQLYTQTERAAWEKRRPLAVMIENSPDARPQSGLSDADVVFEAVAEGGVTRFMAMYYCGVQAFDTTLAPVRSARTYFIDWASGYNFPLYVHVGGADIPGPTNALGQINDYGWAQENDLNQFSIGYPTFIRNEARLGRPVATEHTMETTTEKLWAVGEERNWTNTSPDGDEWSAGFKPWTFQESQPAAGSVTQLSYDFWSGYGQFSVAWNYDAATNTYKRVMAGEPHTDLNNSEQLAASNVVVLLTPERGPLNEAKHMLYQTTGTGKALIFQNGQVVEAQWSKPTRVSELMFTDAKGTAVPLARGLTWISVVDVSTEVVY